MPASTLPKEAKLLSGHTVPLFSFGTYQLTDPSETQAAVLAALAAGVRSLDTAQFYGNEAAVGAAVRASGLAREDVIVTTKVYRGFDTPAELDQNVQESVDALGLGYVDVFLIHSPLMTKAQRLETWKNVAAIAARDGGNGIVRSAGVSNFGVRHLEELAAAGLPVPSVNQIEAHPHLPQTPIVAYCRANGILVQAYCPLMRGQAAEQSLGEGASWAGKTGFGWDHPALKRIAEKHAVSIPQVLVRWSLQQGFSPVVKSADPARIAENHAVWAFALDEADETALTGMNLEQTGEARIALEWNPVDAP